MSRRPRRPASNILMRTPALFDLEPPEPEPELDERERELCSKPELAFLYNSITRTVLNAVRLEVGVVLDFEPRMYDSLEEFIEYLPDCQDQWAPMLTFKDASTGLAGRLHLTLASKSIPAHRPRARGAEDIIRVELVAAPSEQLVEGKEFDGSVTFVLARELPSQPVFMAYYVSNFFAETLRDAYESLARSEKNPEKREEYILKYNLVGTIPYKTLILLPRGRLEQAVEIYRPPPPPKSYYLRKNARSLDELVLAGQVRELLERFLGVVRRRGGRGSLLLVGLEGSGKKTIAYVLARMLGRNAVVLDMANVFAKYVGESEKNLKQFLSSVRVSGYVAVIENVNTLFSRASDTGSGGIAASLRGILLNEMSRIDENKFLAVFTANEEASPMLFETPLLGELKLIVPPPVREDRVKLARRFLRQIAGSEWKLLVETVGSEEKAYEMYADHVAASAVGMTVGELYRLMELILIPLLERLQHGKRTTAYIGRDLRILVRRNLPARLGRLMRLKRLARDLGQAETAEYIEELEREISIASKKMRGESGLLE